MQDASQSIRWLYVAVLFAYLLVQVFALRRLKGDQKRRSNTVLTVMLVLMFGTDVIRDVFFFEDRTASRVGFVVVAVAASIAMIVLVRMFGQAPTGLAGSQASAEDYIQPLKLG